MWIVAEAAAEFGDEHEHSTQSSWDDRV